MNLTLTKHARGIRLHANMSEGFWLEAVSHACDLVSPSIAVNLKISEEIWQGEIVNYSTLQIFGCSVYSLVDSQKRNKLKYKSKNCNFIRFTKGVKGFRHWDPETRSAFTNRDVVFDEESMLQKRS